MVRIRKKRAANMEKRGSRKTSGRAWTPETVGSLTSGDIANLSIEDAAALLTLRGHSSAKVDEIDQSIGEVRERMAALDRELAKLLIWLDSIPQQQRARARKKVMDWVLRMRPEREKLWIKELQLRVLGNTAQKP